MVQRPIRTALFAGLIFTAPLLADERPRVLILGDSIYQQPAAEMRKLLQDQVQVVYPPMPPGEIRNTSTALELLDSWLGEEPWDLIQFNFGLGDLVYRAPGMQAFRVLPRYAGGVRATEPLTYEQNLREVVRRLKATGARVIWASTTPIRHSATDLFELGSEIEYNAIAARVMAQEQIPINDMYHHVRSVIDMDKPAAHGADPFFFDRHPLEAFIVPHFQRMLNLPLVEGETPPTKVTP